MKKLILLLMVCLLLLAACAPAQAPEEAPEEVKRAQASEEVEPTQVPEEVIPALAPKEVVAALGDSLNEGDLEGAMVFIAEDMVFDIEGEEMHGADNVRGMFEELIAGNFRIQLDVQDVDGNTVTTETRTWGDGIPQGAEPNVAMETYVVEDGRIARIAWAPTEETIARLTAVSAVHELGAALNSGDVVGAMAFIAENIVFDSGGEPAEGKAAVQAMFEELIADDFRIEQEVTGFDGRTVTSYTTTWGAGMPPQVEPLKANEKYVIEEGKIASITWTPTEESAAKLAAAMVEIEAMEIVSTVNEAWNAGDVDTLKSLYAANGEVCMPDWGPDCTSGAEEIGQWIEELVAVNFVIEPQSLEVEGAIVTEVAKVWADPSRALEIAPLVTTDVYTLKDGQIINQTSTLDEESAAKLAAAMEAAQEPAAAALTPEFPLATSAEEIMGTWKWAAGEFYLRFDDDGTARLAYALDEIQGAPFYTFSYKFDGTRMAIKEIAASGVAPCSSVGSYEIQLLEDGNIQISAIDDECGRVGDIPGEYEPVS